MTNSQYVRAVEIAKKNNLSSEDMPRFVQFLVEWSEMRGQDFTYDRSYASEWAHRFKKEEEYLCAAGDALISLVYVDGEKKALDKYARELASYNGIPIAQAKKEVIKHIKEAYEYQKQPVPKTFKGTKTIAETKPKRRCICKSAKAMIGKIPNFKKNFKEITK